MVATWPVDLRKRQAWSWRRYAAGALLVVFCLWGFGRSPAPEPSNEQRLGKSGVTCPLTYEAVTLEDVKAGRKPYLFGGMEFQRQRTCVNCARDKLWSQLCQFKTSHYYPAGARKWPTLASCSEEVQWTALKAWEQRGYRLPLELTPCDLWRQLGGGTLFLMGDSIMQDFYKALHCFFFEFWDSLEEEPLTTDEAVLKQLDFMPGWARPVCVRLSGGALRICFFRMDDGAQVNARALPFLQHSGVTSHNDMLIVNMGLHHGQELDSLAKDFAAYVQEHRTALPRVLWQQSSAQHFKTDSGEWPGGEAPFECAPLAGGIFDLEGDGELVLKAGAEDKLFMLQGFWRNRMCDPHMNAAGIPIIQSWNESVALWYAHRDNGAGHECSHYCHPSAPQTWIVALYRTLQQLERRSRPS